MLGNFFFKLFNFSSLVPLAQTVAYVLTNFSTRELPIPPVAPVIKTFLFFKFIFYIFDISY
jgi:uncharacterized membrane protein